MSALLACLLYNIMNNSWFHGLPVTALLLCPSLVLLCTVQSVSVCWSLAFCVMTSPPIYTLSLWVSLLTCIFSFHILTYPLLGALKYVSATLFSTLFSCPDLSLFMCSLGSGCPLLTHFLCVLTYPCLSALQTVSNPSSFASLPCLYPVPHFVLSRK